MLGTVRSSNELLSDLDFMREILIGYQGEAEATCKIRNEFFDACTREYEDCLPVVRRFVVSSKGPWGDEHVVVPLTVEQAEMYYDTSVRLYTEVRDKARHPDVYVNIKPELIEQLPSADGFMYATGDSFRSDKTCKFIKFGYDKYWYAKPNPSIKKYINWLTKMIDRIELIKGTVGFILEDGDIASIKVCHDFIFNTEK